MISFITATGSKPNSLRFEESFEHINKQPAQTLTLFLRTMCFPFQYLSML